MMKLIVNKLLGSAVVILLATSAEVNAQATDVQCDGCVNTGDLAIGAVQTGRIGNQAVTRAKIANGAVGTQQIGNGQITRSKLSGGSVGTNQLGNFQVTTGKISNGAITGQKLAPGTISLGPAALRDEGNTPPCLFEFTVAGTFGQWGSSSNSDCDGQIPLNVPDGTILTSLKCTFFNGSGASAMDARLYRTEKDATPVTLPVFDTPSTMANNTIQEVADFTAVEGTANVDNAAYTYSVAILWGDAQDGADAAFYGCSVGYTGVLLF